MCAVLILARRAEDSRGVLVRAFAVYVAVEWLYMLLGSLIAKNDYFELEGIAFFLSGISLAVCASFDENYAVKQLVAIGAGLAAFIVMRLLLKNLRASLVLRYPAAIGSLAVLAANLLLASRVRGTLNWINLGSFSVQPSEFVKVAFVLVGAVSLEKLLSTASLTKYVLFSLACVGALFLMKDFGAALIFFFVFVLIAFMRSGDVRTIVLVCSAALLGAALVVYFKPYVADRFAAYRRVWDFKDSAGYQQTRVLIYSASGGLFGLGVGEGRLRNVYAASTDLVFGVICEEAGLIVGLAVLLSFAGIAFFAVRSAKTAASTFYSISAVAAAGATLFQLSLNVFGITDLLPLTGVTLPFVSRGGSSMVCSWGLLAYIKAAGDSYKPPGPDLAIKKPVKSAAPSKRKTKGGAA